MGIAAGVREATLGIDKGIFGGKLDCTGVDCVLVDGSDVDVEEGEGGGGDDLRVGATGVDAVACVDIDAGAGAGVGVGAGDGEGAGARVDEADEEEGVDTGMLAVTGVGAGAEDAGGIEDADMGVDGGVDDAREVPALSDGVPLALLEEMFVESPPPPLLALTASFSFSFSFSLSFPNLFISMGLPFLSLMTNTFLGNLIGAGDVAAPADCEGGIPPAPPPACEEESS